MADSARSPSLRLLKRELGRYGVRGDPPLGKARTDRGPERLWDGVVRACRAIRGLTAPRKTVPYCGGTVPILTGTDPYLTEMDQVVARPVVDEFADRDHASPVVSSAP